MWRKTPKGGSTRRKCGITDPKCGRQKTRNLIKSMTYKQQTPCIHGIEENFSRSGGKIGGFEPFPFPASTDFDVCPRTATGTPIVVRTHRTDAKKPPVADRVALAKMGTTL